MNRGQYEERLVELHRRGMRSTMARAFAQYIAELGTPDARFDALYVAGLFETGTSPAPLRRRDRFRRLLQELEPALGLSGCIAECGCFRGRLRRLQLGRRPARRGRVRGRGRRGAEGHGDRAGRAEQTLASAH